MLIQGTACFIFVDDLWREKIKKTNCVGGWRCGLWYCVLVEKVMKGKKAASAPTLVPFERCQSFKDWALPMLQKCNNSHGVHKMSTNCTQFCTRMTTENKLKAHLGYYTDWNTRYYILILKWCLLFVMQSLCISNWSGIDIYSYRVYSDDAGVD